MTFGNIRVTCLTHLSWIQVTFGGYRFGFKVTFRLLSKLFRPKDFFAKKNFLNFFFNQILFQGIFRRHFEDMEMALKLHSGYIKVTFRLHSIQIDMFLHYNFFTQFFLYFKNYFDTLRFFSLGDHWYSSDFQGTFGLHSQHIQMKFRGHSGDICGTFRGYRFGFKVTSRLHWSHIQVTFNSN